MLSSSTYCFAALTLIVFALASAFQKKTGMVIFNPIIVSALVIIGILSTLDIPASVYQEGCRVLSYLLTPATICLAISFYEQLGKLRSVEGIGPVEEIRDRIRIGDWEGDTVYGGVGKGLLVTLVDRKSRHLKMGLLASRTAEDTRKVIEKLLRGLPVKSVSLDNGSEFSEFRKLEAHLHTLVYFAEPHKPWQRGTNENTNDIVRFFFPKGFDFRTVTDEDIQFVEDLINNRPRKCLGWKTPAEILEESVALG